MNRFFLVMGIVLAISTLSYCQAKQNKIEVESSFGFLFLDDDLSLEPSPSVGLGAGYGITDFLQLNLTFFFSPAKQQIRTATSRITSQVSVYSYILSFKLQNRGPVFWRLNPSVNIGAGGTIFDSQSTSLDLGGGETIDINSARDHRFSLNVGGSLAFIITRHFHLNLNYQKYFYRLDVLSHSGINTKPEMMTSDYFGTKLIFNF